MIKSFKIIFIFQLIISFSLTNIPLIKGSEIFQLPQSVYTQSFPLILKGMKLHPHDPLKIDFIVEKNDSMSLNDFENYSEKLIKYFLAALAIPEKDLWVNLSPAESDRIAPDILAQTEMGRDLLDQDYILKQKTSLTLLSEKKESLEFWQDVYSKIYEAFGAVDEVPANLLNKVWIEPKTAEVDFYEQSNEVFIVKNELQIKQERDSNGEKLLFNKNVNDALKFDVENILKEKIIPEIEYAVNHSEEFLPLRQIYQTLILASWYKKNLAKSFLGDQFAEKSLLEGFSISMGSREVIYHDYLRSFEEGVFEMIREDYDPVTQSIIPRKYFSGGASLMQLGPIVQERKILGSVSGYENVSDDAMLISIDFLPKLSFSKAVSNVLKTFVLLVLILISSPVLSQDKGNDSEKEEIAFVEGKMSFEEIINNMEQFEKHYYASLYDEWMENYIPAEIDSLFEATNLEEYFKIFDQQFGSDFSNKQRDSYFEAFVDSTINRFMNDIPQDAEIRGDLEASLRDIADNYHPGLFYFVAFNKGFKHADSENLFQSDSDKNRMQDIASPFSYEGTDGNQYIYFPTFEKNFFLENILNTINMSGLIVHESFHSVVKHYGKIKYNSSKIGEHISSGAHGESGAHFAGSFVDPDFTKEQALNLERKENDIAHWLSPIVHFLQDSTVVDFYNISDETVEKFLNPEQGIKVYTDKFLNLTDLGLKKFLDNGYQFTDVTTAKDEKPLKWEKGKDLKKWDIRNPITNESYGTLIVWDNKGDVKFTYIRRNQGLTGIRSSTGALKFGKMDEKDFEIHFVESVESLIKGIELKYDSPSKSKKLQRYLTERLNRLNDRIFDETGFFLGPDRNPLDKRQPFYSNDSTQVGYLLVNSTEVAPDTIALSFQLTDGRDTWGTKNKKLGFYDHTGTKLTFSEYEYDDIINALLLAYETPVEKGIKEKWENILVQKQKAETGREGDSDIYASFDGAGGVNLNLPGESTVSNIHIARKAAGVGQLFEKSSTKNFQSEINLLVDNSGSARKNKKDIIAAVRKIIQKNPLAVFNLGLIGDNLSTGEGVYHSGISGSSVLNILEADPWAGATFLWNNLSFVIENASQDSKTFAFTDGKSDTSKTSLNGDPEENIDYIQAEILGNLSRENVELTVVSIGEQASSEVGNFVQNSENNINHIPVEGFEYLGDAVTGHLSRPEPSRYNISLEGYDVAVELRGGDEKIVRSFSYGEDVSEQGEEGQGNLEISGSQTSFKVQVSRSVSGNPSIAIVGDDAKYVLQDGDVKFKIQDQNISRESMDPAKQQVALLIDASKSIEDQIPMIDGVIRDFHQNNLNAVIATVIIFGADGIYSWSEGIDNSEEIPDIETFLTSYYRINAEGIGHGTPGGNALLSLKSAKEKGVIYDSVVLLGDGENNDGRYLGDGEGENKQLSYEWNEANQMELNRLFQEMVQEGTRFSLVTTENPVQKGVVLKRFESLLEGISVSDLVQAVNLTGGEMIVASDNDALSLQLDQYFEKHFGDREVVGSRQFVITEVVVQAQETGSDKWVNIAFPVRIEIGGQKGKVPEIFTKQLDKAQLNSDTVGGIRLNTNRLTTNIFHSAQKGFRSSYELPPLTEMVGMSFAIKDIRPYRFQP